MSKRLDQEKIMIVKVQQSIITNAEKPQVLVYNEDRSKTFEGDLPKEIKKLLKGRPKAYFEAEIIDFFGEIKFVLGKEVRTQNW